MSRKRPKARPGSLPLLDDTRVDWTDGERLMAEYVYAVFNQFATGKADTDISIPRDMAGELMRSFTAILEGNEATEALKLKPGRKRTDLRDYRKQKYAAKEVEKKMREDGKSQFSATVDVAGDLEDLIGEISEKQVERWYKKFRQDI